MCACVCVCMHVFVCVCAYMCMCESIAGNRGRGIPIDPARDNTGSHLHFMHHNAEGRAIYHKVRQSKKAVIAPTKNSRIQANSRGNRGWTAIARAIPKLPDQSEQCQGQANFSVIFRWAATKRRSKESHQSYNYRAHQPPGICKRSTEQSRPQPIDSCSCLRM